MKNPNFQMYSASCPLGQNIKYLYRKNKIKKGSIRKKLGAKRL